MNQPIPESQASTNDEVEPTIPLALYLDTSAVDRLPVDLAHGGFAPLNELCRAVDIPIYIPEVCISEFTQHKKVALPGVCKQAQKALDQFHSAIRDVANHSGTVVEVPWLQETVPLSPEFLSDHVEERFQETLRTNGVEVVPTVEVS